MNKNELSDSNELALFVVLAGCTPMGRNIEQHDVFFGVAKHLDDLTEDIKLFWHKPVIDQVTGAVKKILPGLDSTAMGEELLKNFSRRDKVHIDAWTKVQYADGYKVSVQPKSSATNTGELKLYFINLGGYKENVFEEYHKKLFVVAAKPSEAKAKIMADSFMKEFSPQNLNTAGKAHVDDQHKIDFEADDIVCVSEAIGNNYSLVLQPVQNHPANTMTIGYIKLNYTE